MRKLLVIPASIIWVLFAQNDGLVKTFYESKALKTEGNYVKAKTGGLSGVSNLSGYVFSPRYGPVAFSLLMSGYRGSSQPYRNLQDAIIKQLLYG